MQKIILQVANETPVFKATSRRDEMDKGQPKLPRFKTNFQNAQESHIITRRQHMACHPQRCIFREGDWQHESASRNH